MITACPDDCTFDWEQFHKDLDVALAHFIEETGSTPSGSTVMGFLQFSNRKQKLAKEKK